MSKLFTLLFIIILAFASTGGYVYLNQQITSGEKKIAEGEKQLANGQRMLREGKAKLANGKQRLARARGTYRQVNSFLPFLNVVSKLPVSNIVMQEANKQISEGAALIARGEVAVRNGEQRLAAGKLELLRAKERLHSANEVRIACGVGAIFFIALALLLGFYWRQSLARIFVRPH